jgi:hypothetical protein
MAPPAVCTPSELTGWPIDAWLLLDCTDQERRRRLCQQAGPTLPEDAIHDAHEYRALGLRTCPASTATCI